MSKKKTPADIACVICLWRWIPEASTTTGFRYGDWAMVEAFGTDEDLHVLTPSKHACAEREPWRDWMFAAAGDGEEDDDPEFEEIMGRAVTMWSFDSGVSLVEFHPPAWCDWIAPNFIDYVRPLPNWALLLEGGPKLLVRTGEAARKLILTGKV